MFQWHVTSVFQCHITFYCVPVSVISPLAFQCHITFHCVPLSVISPSLCSSVISRVHCVPVSYHEYTVFQCHITSTLCSSVMPPRLCSSVMSRLVCSSIMSRLCSSVISLFTVFQCESYHSLLCSSVISPRLCSSVISSRLCSSVISRVTVFQSHITFHGVPVPYHHVCVPVSCHVCVPVPSLTDYISTCLWPLTGVPRPW